MQISYDITSTLRSQTKHHEPIVLERNCIPFTPSCHGGYQEGLGTLRASGADLGGGSEILVCEANNMEFSAQRIDEYKQSDQASTLAHRMYRSATDLITEGDENVNSVVRRLTPLECERLQGMPDNWSKYGINEKGEVYELSDTARYKLQGNGIATPFWRWMLKRISAQYERTPTLGSLFDGQASFPMIWEGINGKGTALWSSEIDKHAVAVAKYHFPEEGDIAS